MQQDSKVRVDKWLWAARFYKTRSLATDAINGGKVHVNGQRIKPSRAVNIGDVVKLRQGELQKSITVTAISDRRGPASMAATLYEESADSQQQREAFIEQRKLLRASLPDDARRPNKKQRRQIVRFKNIHDQ